MANKHRSRGINFSDGVVDPEWLRSIDPSDPAIGEILLSMSRQGRNLHFIQDLDERYLWVNEVFLKRFDLTREQVIGKIDAEIFGEKSSRVVSKRDDATYIETRIVHRGEVAYFSTNRHPIRDPSGKPIGVIASVRDVTEHKQREERSNEILDAISEVVFVVDRDWRFLFANRAAEELLGNPESELLGRKILDLYPETERGAFLKEYVEAWRQMRHREFVGFSEKYHRYFRVNVYPTEDHLTVMGRDVTDLVLAETERRHYAERLENLTRITSGFVWWADAEGKTPNAPEPEEPNQWDEMGWGWINHLHPDDRERAARTWAKALESKERYEIEYRVVKDGVSRWHLSRGVPIFEDDGAVREWVGSSIDIHAQRAWEAELEREVAIRTAELKEANRELEFLNQTLSHDLTSYCRAIGATSMELLDTCEGLPEEAKNLLARQQKTARQMAKLVETMLAYSRLGSHSIRRTKVNLSEPAKSIARGLEETFPGAIFIEPSLETNGDPELLRVALENLIGNAVKYSPQGGQIRVGKDSEGFFVKDEGVGFNPAYAQRIFLPFERLQRDDEFPGVGIGLANVQRIVERHHGRVWAESEGEGQGSTFHFVLPDGEVDLD